MRYLARVVAIPIGANILGLLEMFAFVGILFAVSELPVGTPRPLAIGLFLLGAIASVAFDVWWRRRQPEASLWLRLFAPYTGGCMVFVPIWLLFPLAAVACTIAVLMQEA